MTYSEQLAHVLKLRFGLQPGEPDANQLQAIRARIQAVSGLGRVPSDADWRTAVAAVCPSFQTHVYAGIDNSDLNTLLSLATQSAGGRK